MKKLIEDLNNIKTKIQNTDKSKFNLTEIIKLLKFMNANNLINDEEYNMIINNESLNIKELKYFHFREFSISDEVENYLQEFILEAIDKLPNNIDYQSVYYLLSEILINVYKHSKFNNAYLQTIIYNDEKNIDFCIFDNGIGIPGSFKESSIDTDTDCEEIYDAINGKTSDKEKYVIHGRGLNSSANLTTLGFDGEMIIASGKGICEITKEGAKTYLNDHEIHGTFVILRINNKKINNIYDYLKYKKIHKKIDDVYGAN